MKNTPRVIREHIALMKQTLVSSDHWRAKRKTLQKKKIKKIKGSIEMMKDNTKEILQKMEDKNSQEVREDKKTRQPRRKRV